MVTDIQTGDDPTVIDTENDSDVTANLWTKKGRRLYLNGFGSASANRYIDLDAGTVEGGYTSGFDVCINDDAGTLAVTGPHDETVLVVDLDLDLDRVRVDDQPDETEGVAGELVADGGSVAESDTDTDTDTDTDNDNDNDDNDDNDDDNDLSIGDVYVRRSYDGTYPARVEVVADDHYDYRVEIYNTHGVLKGTQTPAYPNSPGAVGVTLSKIRRGVRGGHLKLTDADPGDLPPSTDERVVSFCDSDRATVAAGVVFDDSIFERWQKHGHDRLYVRDLGEGYVDIGGDRVTFGDALVHPENPITHIGGLDHERFDHQTSDGRRVVFAHDGASSHWPILVYPAEVED